MDLILVVISGLLILIGVIGSIVPFLPGAPLSWLGLLLLYFTSVIPFNYPFLIITFIITAIIFALQYIIPAYGTKRYGGSRWGMWGTIVGLIVGIITPIPFGFLIGPFIGAYIGELLNKSNSSTALRAAYGSFIGFLASTFIELMLTLIFMGFYIARLWTYRDLLF